MRWVTRRFLLRRFGSGLIDGAYAYYYPEGDTLAPINGTVYLSHGCNQHEAVDTLIHEWAHLLRHLIPAYDVEREPHDGVWASIHNLILRHWHGEAIAVD